MKLKICIQEVKVIICHAKKAFQGGRIKIIKSKEIGRDVTMNQYSVLEILK